MLYNNCLTETQTLKNLALTQYNSANSIQELLLSFYATKCLRTKLPKNNKTNNLIKSSHVSFLDFSIFQLSTFPPQYHWQALESSPLHRVILGALFHANTVESRLFTPIGLVWVATMLK